MKELDRISNEILKKGPPKNGATDAGGSAAESSK
jgi:hypothetical protein